MIPGTKNTVDDLLAIREAGFDDELRAFDGPIVGLCGGYQLLGERLRGVDTEASSAAATELASTTLPAVGLLPVETTFMPEKRVVDTTFELDGAGPLAGASGSVSGYEIHMGTTEATAAVERPFARDGDASAALGASAGDVLGCYLHGLFETETARDAFVERVFEAAGRERPTGATPEPSPYAQAAALVADNCSLDFLDLD